MSVWRAEFEPHWLKVALEITTSFLIPPLRRYQLCGSCCRVFDIEEDLVPEPCSPFPSMQESAGCTKPYKRSHRLCVNKHVLLNPVVFLAGSSVFGQDSLLR